MNRFIGWVGGKKLLRNAICDRFPNKIGKYVEVFGGAGWVLFNKDRHAEIEVNNDINSNLVNLFRCVKYHPDAIIKEMSYLLNSREIFNCFTKRDIDGLTDIQKAARYLYLIKTSYGCKLGSYGAKLKNISNLTGVKGKFILSYNDCEFVSNLYKEFNVEEIKRQNNFASRYGE